MEKNEIIRALNLKPHPEGGYFKEMDRSDIPFKDGQTLFSSILFLLGENDISHLHVLEEDELWYYQDGEDCLIYEIDPKTGKLTVTALGKEGHCYQHLVRKGMIFGSKIKGKTFTLVGCMVSPSFTYEHFVLLKKEDLPPLSDEDFAKVADMIIA